MAIISHDIKKVVIKQRTRYIAPCVKSGIYFVQAVGGSGLIKIGWSIDCDERLRALQIGSPVPLCILAIIPGTRRREQLLHEYWKHLRAHGEWFQPSPELLESIAQSQRMFNA